MANLHGTLIGSAAAVLALAAALCSGLATAGGSGPPTQPADALHKQGPGCQEIASARVPVSLCVDTGEWEKVDLRNGAEATFHNHNFDIFIMLITEPTVYALDIGRQGILGNIEKVASDHKVDTQIDETISIDGHQFGHLIYEAKLGKLDVTYENYFTSFAGKGSLQLISFTASQNFDVLRPLFAGVVETVRVGGQK